MKLSIIYLKVSISINVQNEKNNTFFHMYSKLSLWIIQNLFNIIRGLSIATTIYDILLIAITLLQLSILIFQFLSIIMMI